MSQNPPPESSSVDQDFARIWAESAAHVLEQLKGSPFTATSLPAATANEQESTWSRFKATGQLAGEFALQISRSDAVRLTQLLMSEPLDAAAAWDEGRADALGELLRQFAGVASTSCKSKYGGEVQFSPEPGAPPEWQPVSRAQWVFAAPKLDPLQWTLSLSPELHAALKSSAPAAAPHAVTDSVAQQVSSPPSSQAPDAAAPPPANLDLLLDVELEASLRFGQREMLLRDILELHPGSVIELDRRVQEPAELLVSGRVIAHGEVVIVDGNYGLRITDIAQATQRLESLSI